MDVRKHWKTTSNLWKGPKFMLNAPNLLMPWPQDSILQHLLKSEASPEGDIKRYQQCLVYWTKYPKFMLKASKLWRLGPQDCILQHLLEPEGGPEAGIRNYQSCFFRGLLCWTKYPKSMLKASKLLMLGPQDCILQHLLEPEAGPGAGIRNYH